MRSVTLRPAAEADVADAYRWYESQDPGLGLEFLRAVEVCLTQIRRQPEAYAMVHRDARRALLRRFPYAVYFIVGPGTIEVVACFHVRREPRRWQSRL